jgi:CheY-like chemotaxis protein
MTTETRILVADRSSLMRGWLGMAVSRAVPWRHVDVTTVAGGADLLERLGEDAPYDLVVANCDLPDVGGGEVLAMARTAGLDVPFLLLSHLPTQRLQALVQRVPHATLLDDPLDAARITATARRMLDHNSSLVTVPRQRQLIASRRSRVSGA